MHGEITKDHPRQKFVFFVAQGADENVRADVQQLLRTIAESRQWILGPPRYVEVTEAPGSIDMPSNTVGGMHELYSALPSHTLARDVDAKNLKEVEHIVNLVQQFSKAKGLAFDFELDGQFVGAIENGRIDRTLSEGLLRPWRGHLSI